jgi:hypothetical protein
MLWKYKNNFHPDCIVVRYFGTNRRLTIELDFRVTDAKMSVPESSQRIHDFENIFNLPSNISKTQQP